MGIGGHHPPDNMTAPGGVVKPAMNTHQVPMPGARATSLPEPKRIGGGAVGRLSKGSDKSTEEPKLGNWVPTYDENGRFVKRTFFPYPPEVPEPTAEEKAAISKRKYKTRRRRR